MARAGHWGNTLTELVDRARLLEAVDDGPFDAHAGLIAQLLGTDVALVSIIDVDAQRFVGGTGLPGEAAETRSTPLSCSLCQYVARDDVPLVIEDIAADEELATSDAHLALGLRSYMGLPLHTPDGTAVGAVCAASGQPRDWDATHFSVLAAVRDLVESQVAQLLAAAADHERVDEVTLLLSTLRHELGGELAVVIGGIETAKLDGIPRELHDRVLDNAHRDASRAIATLDALLRMDSRAPMEIADVDLRATIHSAVTESPVAGRSSRVRLDVESREVRTEPTLLGRVVSNLVDNACKYSRELVEVTSLVDGDRVAVAVSDRGEGFPPDVARQLFEPFARRAPTDRSGFGLGLFIVRQLAHRLGATLEVTSQSTGTTVRVWLPPEGPPRDVEPLRV